MLIISSAAQARAPANHVGEDVGSYMLPTISLTLLESNGRQPLLKKTPLNTLSPSHLFSLVFLPPSPHFYDATVVAFGRLIQNVKALQ